VALLVRRPCVPAAHRAHAGGRRAARGRSRRDRRPAGEPGATASLSAGATQRWQIRVHPPASGEPGPFELLAPDAENGATAHLTLTALREQLGRLREARTDKPLLAPHQDSRSQDLLDAIAAIEERWPDDRRAAVLPVAVNR
jgi:hypothetical protein